MKKIIYFTIAFTLWGCTLINNQKDSVYIYYKYNDICITRIDKENEHYFYFGEFSKNSELPKSYFIGRYIGGFDASFSGYLIFKKRSVEFFQLYGEIIERVGVDNRFYTFDDYIVNKNEDTLSHKRSYPTIKQIKLSIDVDTTNYDKTLYGKWEYDKHNSTIDKFILPINKGMRLSVDTSHYYLVSSNLTNYENRILFDQISKSSKSLKNVIFFDHDYLIEKKYNRKSGSKVTTIYPE